jgi:hypothetical protein
VNFCQAGIKGESLYTFLSCLKCNLGGGGWFSLPLTMGGRMVEDWLKYKVGQAGSIHKQLTSGFEIPCI